MADSDGEQQTDTYDGADPGENVEGTGTEGSDSTAESPWTRPTEVKSDDGATAEGWKPDKQYKGLQQRLEREQTARKDAEAKLATATTQPSAAPTGDILQTDLGKAMLTSIAQESPEKAAALQQYSRTQALEQENTQLKHERDQATYATQVEEIQSQNLTQLQGIVEDSGVDPASPLIDYGTESQPLFERMGLVRESVANAKATAKVDPVVTRSEEAGTAHNVEGGSATSVQEMDVPTDAQMAEIRTAYARNPTKDNRARMMAADEALRKAY